ncbi:hypothetical protein NQ317_008745 [Molorchus minor]|uniref:N-acetyltransferase domain-containing protein n=1 Tax=Molorchus minor TaxID=1323400 RepID=A0ABQ9IRT1_9CUCU|nr:hypothetical protein NQ317_008745 [Molorchus minor]
MYYIVLREYKQRDLAAISEVVRNAYLSNVFSSWLNALFNEITFQLIIILSAVLFICFGVPLIYCAVSIPIVLIGLYVVIYSTILLKSAQVIYEKKSLMCWVAEAYEPLFNIKNPKNCWYKIITENEIDAEAMKTDECRKVIIGTVAVMRHFHSENWGWLFRLAVDKRYRRKGIGMKLTQIVQNWCRENHFNNIELVMSECQEGARELFNDAGFNVKQLYHKKLFTSAVSLQMFQLRCEV